MKYTSNLIYFKFNMYKFIRFLQTDYLDALQNEIGEVPSLTEHLDAYLKSGSDEETALLLIITTTLVGNHYALDDVDEYKEVLKMLKLSDEFVINTIIDLLNDVVKKGTWDDLESCIADSWIRAFWFVELSKFSNFNLNNIYSEIEAKCWDEIEEDVGLANACRMQFKYAVNHFKKN
jgi:hypothetical protein